MDDVCFHEGVIGVVSVRKGGCAVTGRWDQPGVPQKGWSLTNVVDLGEDVEPGEEIEYGTCSMCGQHPIRYVHFVIHPEVADEMEVGCDCAERMTNDYVRPRLREKALRGRASAKARWLGRKWRTSRKGNQYLKAEGLIVTVFPDRWRAGRWKFSLGEISEEAPPPTFGEKSLESQAAAKLAAFDEFWRRTGEFKR